jgi:hypothetical protein
MTRGKKHWNHRATETTEQRKKLIAPEFGAG